MKSCSFAQLYQAERWSSEWFQQPLWRSSSPARSMSVCGAVLVGVHWWWGAGGRGGHQADGAEYVHDLVRVEEVVEGAGPKALRQLEDLRRRGSAREWEGGGCSCRDGTLMAAPIMTKNSMDAQHQSALLLLLWRRIADAMEKMRMRDKPSKESARHTALGARRSR